MKVRTLMIVVLAAGLVVFLGVMKEGRPMTTLTPEQRRELELAGGDPVRIEDPITREYYVILKAAVYDKLREQVEVERVDPSFYEYGEFSPVVSLRPAGA